MSQALVPFNAVLAGPVGSLDAYLQTVTQIPVLSREEEKKLAVRYREDGDLDAARELIISNLRFVVHVARGYNGYGLPIGDLIQEGNIGLMKAVKRFDPSVGVRLVSFAVHWIRAEIHEFVLKNWRVVKVATTKAQRKLFFNLRKSKKRLGWLSAKETEAVASDLGVSAKEVLEMEKRLAAHDMSFDGPASSRDDDEGFSPSAVIRAPASDPAQEVEDADLSAFNHQRLTAAMNTLDDRSRDIVERRWLADGKTTLSTLATEYGISAERVRQIETNAIRKMKQLIAG